MKYILEQVFKVPDGIKISKNAYGNCLVATKKFKVGETICEGIHSLVPNENIYDEYEVLIESEGEIKPYIISSLNTVEYENKRIFYTWDGYMNHSCLANSYSYNYSATHYLQIATKDIMIGDEITCNYLLFDYTCDGHQFTCGCSSAKCYSNIRGFKNLTLDDQIELLNNTDECVKDEWLADNPNIIIIDDMQIDANISIPIMKNAYMKVVSNNEFKSGELIYSIDIKKIKQSDILIYKLDSSYYKLNNMTHSINRSDYRIFGYFDIFVNHSCMPNTYNIYSNDDSKCQVFAKTNIKIGDEITVDYTLEDYLNDNKPFECNCNSIICKKYI